MGVGVSQGLRMHLECGEGVRGCLKLLELHPLEEVEERWVEQELPAVLTKGKVQGMRRTKTR
eukprot:318705-Pyramimonas_sp.AAC.2